MSKRKRRKRTLSQKILWIMSFVIAGSMIISLFIVALPGASPATPTPLPTWTRVATNTPAPTETQPAFPTFGPTATALASPTPKATEPPAGPVPPTNTPGLEILPPTVAPEFTSTITPTLTTSP